MRAATLTKFTATTLSLVYFSTNVALANVPASIWADRQRASRPSEMLQIPKPGHSLLEAPTPTLHENDFSNLTRFGTVRRISNLQSPSTKSKTIIHIQDVHQNVDAQKNIGLAIQELAKTRPVSAVALEGAFGPVDISAFKQFQDQASVKIAADFMLEKGLLTGAMHAVLTSKVLSNQFSVLSKKPSLRTNELRTENFQVIGVDDTAHYEANVEAYRQSAPLVKAEKTKLTAWKKDLTERKLKAFSLQLSAFDAKVQAYNDGTINLGDYAKAIAGNPQKDIKLFLEALDLERTMNFSRVEDERTRLVTLLTHKLNASQITKLTQAAAGFRAGEMTQAAFYRFVQQLCDAAQVRIADFPAMNNYIRYVQLADAIDAEALLKELRQAEADGYNRLAQTKAGKALVVESRWIYLTSKLIDFSLTKDEWKEYEVLSNQFSVLSQKPSLRTDALRTENFKKFYKEAEIRDQKMAENLLRTNEPRTENLKGMSILVTGGFHSAGIDQRLTEQGYTVVTFVPKIAKADLNNASGYLSAFTQEKTPLEKLVEGQKLFLSPKIWISAHQIHLALLTALRRIWLAAGNIAKDEIGEHLFQLTGHRLTVDEFSFQKGSVSITTGGMTLAADVDPVAGVLKREYQRAADVGFLNLQISRLWQAMKATPAFLHVLVSPGQQRELIQRIEGRSTEARIQYLVSLRWIQIAIGIGVLASFGLSTVINILQVQPSPMAFVCIVALTNPLSAVVLATTLTLVVQHALFPEAPMAWIHPAVTWHKTTVKEGIPKEKALQELRAIRADLAEINKHLLSYQRLDEDILDEDELEGFAHGIDLFNEGINQPLDRLSTENLFLRIHAVVAHPLTPYRGAYTPELDEAAFKRLEAVFVWMFSPSFQSLFDKNPKKAAAAIFTRLHNIHSLDDANTRMSSFMMNLVLLKAGLPPFLLTKESIVALQKQRFRVVEDEFDDHSATNILRAKQIRKELLEKTSAQTVSWFWKKIFPFLKTRGWSDKQISALAGPLEEPFYAGLTIGVAGSLIGFGLSFLLTPILAYGVGYSIGALLGVLWVVWDHWSSVYSWEKGALTLRGPPTKWQRFSVSFFIGFLPRLAYLAILYSQRNNLDWTTHCLALGVLVAWHSFYNPFFSRWIGGAAGMANRPRPQTSGKELRSEFDGFLKKLEALNKSDWEEGKSDAIYQEIRSKLSPVTTLLLVDNEKNDDDDKFYRIGIVVAVYLLDKRPENFTEAQLNRFEKFLEHHADINPSQERQEKYLTLPGLTQLFLSTIFAQEYYLDGGLTYDSMMDRFADLSTRVGAFAGDFGPRCLAINFYATTLHFQGSTDEPDMRRVGPNLNKAIELLNENKMSRGVKTKLERAVTLFLVRMAGLEDGFPATFNENDAPEFAVIVRDNIKLFKAMFKRASPVIREAAMRAASADNDVYTMWYGFRPSFNHWFEFLPSWKKKYGTLEDVYAASKFDPEFITEFKTLSEMAREYRWESVDGGRMLDSLDRLDEILNEPDYFNAAQTVGMAPGQINPNWHETVVENGLPIDKLAQGLKGIREKIDPINNKLKHQQKYRVEELRDNDIEAYGKAAKYFNSILNQPMDAKKMLDAFSNLDDILNEEYYSTFGKLDDIDRETLLHMPLDEMFSPEFYEELKSDPLTAAARMYVEIYRGQVFGQGNSRLAGFLMNYVLLKNGFAPFILTPENAIAYARLRVKPIDHPFPVMRDINPEKFANQLLGRKAKTDPTTGMAPWIWKWLMPILKARGWTDKQISAMGGVVEEPIYAAFYISLIGNAIGIALNYFGKVDMTTALIAGYIIGAVFSVGMIAWDHWSSAYVWKDGALSLRGPPTKEDKLRLLPSPWERFSVIFFIGILPRVAYLTIIYFTHQKFGLAADALALFAVIAWHTLYNPFFSRWIGGSAGMAAKEKYLADEKYVKRHEGRLGDLEEHHGLILRRRFIDGATQSEVAAELGTDSTNVMRMTATALTQLRQLVTFNEMPDSELVAKHHKKLNKLSSNGGELLRRYFLKNQTLKKIAYDLDGSKPTVGRRIQRALVELKKLVGVRQLPDEKFVKKHEGRLEELGDAYSEVLRKIYIEGKNQSQAGAEIGTDSTGAASRARTGVKRLRELVASGQSSPLKLVTENEDRLKELDSTHREILQLRFLKGFPQTQVAVMLGKSNATIRDYTRRAVAELRALVDSGQPSDQQLVKDNKGSLKDLDPNVAKVLRLHYLKGKTQEEIAAEMKKSRRTIQRWAETGLKELGDLAGNKSVVGMTPWIWKRAMPLLRSWNMPDWLISALGGFEELLYAGVTIGVAGSGIGLFLSIWFTPMIAYGIGYSIGALLGVLWVLYDHSGSVYAWDKGALTLRSPPTEDNEDAVAPTAWQRTSIALFIGLLPRLVYLGILYSQRNNLDWTTHCLALGTVIAWHSFYNPVISRLIGGAAGMAPPVLDARREAIFKRYSSEFSPEGVAKTRRAKRISIEITQEAINEFVRTTEQIFDNNMHGENRIKILGWSGSYSYTAPLTARIGLFPPGTTMEGVYANMQARRPAWHDFDEQTGQRDKSIELPETQPSYPSDIDVYLTWENLENAESLWPYFDRAAQEIFEKYGVYLHLFRPGQYTQKPIGQFEGTGFIEKVERDHPDFGFSHPLNNEAALDAIAKWRELEPQNNPDTEIASPVEINFLVADRPDTWQSLLTGDEGFYGKVMPPIALTDGRYLIPLIGDIYETFVEERENDQALSPSAEAFRLRAPHFYKRYGQNISSLDSALIQYLSASDRLNGHPESGLATQYQYSNIISVHTLKSLMWILHEKRNQELADFLRNTGMSFQNLIDLSDEEFLSRVPARLCAVADDLRWADYSAAHDPYSDVAFNQLAMNRYKDNVRADQGTAFDFAKAAARRFATYQSRGDYLDVRFERRPISTTPATRFPIENAERRLRRLLAANDPVLAAELERLDVTFDQLIRMNDIQDMSRWLLPIVWYRSTELELADYENSHGETAETREVKAERERILNGSESLQDIKAVSDYVRDNGIERTKNNVQLNVRVKKFTDQDYRERLEVSRVYDSNGNLATVTGWTFLDLIGRLSFLYGAGGFAQAIRPDGTRVAIDTPEILTQSIANGDHLTFVPGRLDVKALGTVRPRLHKFVDDDNTVRIDDGQLVIESVENSILGSMRNLFNSTVNPIVKLFLEIDGQLQPATIQQLLGLPGMFLKTRYQPGFPSPSGTEITEFSAETMKAERRFEGLGGEMIYHTFSRVPLFDASAKNNSVAGSLRYTRANGEPSLRLNEALDEFKRFPDTSLIGRWKAEGVLMEKLREFFAGLGNNHFALLAIGKVVILQGAGRYLHGAGGAQAPSLNTGYDFFRKNTDIVKGRLADLGDYFDLKDSYSDIHPNRDTHSSIAALLAMTGEFLNELEKFGVMEVTPAVRQDLLSAYVGGFLHHQTTLDIGAESFDLTAIRFAHKLVPGAQDNRVSSYIRENGPEKFEETVNTMMGVMTPLLKEWPVLFIFLWEAFGAHSSTPTRFSPYDDYFEPGLEERITNPDTLAKLRELALGRPHGYEALVRQLRFGTQPSNPNSTRPAPNFSPELVRAINTALQTQQGIVKLENGKEITLEEAFVQLNGQTASPGTVGLVWLPLLMLLEAFGVSHLKAFTITRTIAGAVESAIAISFLQNNDWSMNAILAVAGAIVGLHAFIGTFVFNTDTNRWQVAFFDSSALLSAIGKAMLTFIAFIPAAFGSDPFWILLVGILPHVVANNADVLLPVENLHIDTVFDRGVRGPRVILKHVTTVADLVDLAMLSREVRNAENTAVVAIAAPQYALFAGMYRRTVGIVNQSTLPKDDADLYSYDDVLNSEQAQRFDAVRRLTASGYSEGQVAIISRTQVPFGASSGLARIIAVWMNAGDGWVRGGMKMLLKSYRMGAEAA